MRRVGFVFALLACLLALVACGGGTTVVYVTATPLPATQPPVVIVVTATPLPVVVTATPAPSSTSAGEATPTQEIMTQSPTPTPTYDQSAVNTQLACVNQNPNNADTRCQVNENWQLKGDPSCSIFDGSKVCQPPSFDRFYTKLNSAHAPVSVSGDTYIYDVAYRNGFYGFTFYPTTFPNQRYILAISGQVDLVTPNGRDTIDAGSLALEARWTENGKTKTFTPKSITSKFQTFREFWVVECPSTSVPAISTYFRLPFGSFLPGSTVSIYSVELIAVPSDYGGNAVVSCVP